MDPLQQPDENGNLWIWVLLSPLILGLVTLVSVLLD